MSNTEIKPVKLHKLPFVIKKNSICDLTKQKYELLMHYVKNTTQNIHKEDVIYKSAENDFLNGKYPELIIINKLNKLLNSSRTFATYRADGSVVELNSDAVTKVIGQKNYDTVFSALCSVINQELKIQGILALLSIDSKKTNNFKPVEKLDEWTQTDQTCRELLMREKQRRHIKRKTIRSYIVKDDMLPEKPKKKLIVDPKDIHLIENIKLESDGNEKKSNNLPDLKFLVDEDSNISDISTGNLSITSCNIPNVILENPSSIFQNIDRHTEVADSIMSVTMLDGSIVTIKGNPDRFHLATSEVLQHLSSHDKKKMMMHQAYIDWKFCLQRDEDDNLPLHSAVLSDDAELLKRQCHVLKSRNESLDIPSGINLTALQLSILHDKLQCTSILLQLGADPLTQDEESRTLLHLAAEVGAGQVYALIAHCRANAREILKGDEELWKPHFENRTDKELADYLIHKMCILYDNQGYTPLMIASKMGKHENVQLLVGAAPGSVNMAMPTSGDTALYLAVGKACTDCNAGLNKTQVDEKYLKTITILVENGADPAIDNGSGSNVNTLLSDFNIPQISVLIANKLTSVKYFGGNETNVFGSYMLVKDPDGKVKIEDIKKSPKTDTKKKENLKKTVTNTDDRNNKVTNTDDRNNKVTNTDDRNNKVTNTDEENQKVVNTVNEIKKDKKNLIVKSMLMDKKPIITKLISIPQNRGKPLILKRLLQNTADETKTINSEKAKFVKIMPKESVIVPNTTVITTSRNTTTTSNASKTKTMTSRNKRRNSNTDSGPSDKISKS